MRRRALTSTLSTSQLLQPLLQRLINVTSFRHSKMLYSRPVLFKHTNNCDFVFSNHLNCRIYKRKFLTHVSSLVSTFYFSYQFNFFFDNQNLSFVCEGSLLLMAGAEKNFKHSYHYYCQFSDLEFI